MEDNPRDYFKGIFCITAGIFILAVMAGLVNAQTIDLEAIKEIESGGNPNAVGAAGEVGLFQIMPVVRKSYNQRTGHRYTRQDLFNPEVNKAIADWYLHDRIPEMLRHYGKAVTVENIIWSYNAGIGRLLNGVKPRITERYLQKYRRF